jgi:oligoribonuclease
MNSQRHLYCWFDTEYTTLDLERAKLLEIALIVTDDELRPVRPDGAGIPRDLLRKDGFCVFVIPPPREEISDHVQKNYGPLLERCRGEGRTAEAVEGFLASYMDSFPECRAERVQDRPVLAGNSIYADYFLARKYLPRFLSRLSYRLFDVTTLKLEWLFHYREKRFEKLGKPEAIRKFYRGEDEILGDKHDAYYDVQASIAELAYYRSRLSLRA